MTPVWLEHADNPAKQSTPPRGGVALSRMFTSICQNLLSQIYDSMRIIVKYFIRLYLSEKRCEFSAWSRLIARSGLSPLGHDAGTIGASLIIRAVSRVWGAGEP